MEDCCSSSWKESLREIDESTTSKTFSWITTVLFLLSIVVLRLYKGMISSGLKVGSKVCLTLPLIFGITSAIADYFDDFGFKDSNLILFTKSLAEK